MRQVNFPRTEEAPTGGSRRDFQGQQYVNERAVSAEPLEKMNDGGGYNFRHPMSDGGVPTENVGDIPPTKKKICRFYAETGFCTTGEDCDFLHERPAGHSPEPAVCRFFAEKGYCAMEENCEFSHDVQPKDEEIMCKAWMRKEEEDERTGHKGDIAGYDFNPYDQNWRRDDGMHDQRDRGVIASAFLNEDRGRPDSRIPSAFLNSRKNFEERENRMSQFETSDGGHNWGGDLARNERIGGPESQFPRYEPRRPETEYWTECDQLPKPSPFNRFTAREPVVARAPSLFLSSKPPGGKNKPICKQFRQGKCTFGPRCRFSHEEPSESLDNQEQEKVDNSGANQNISSGGDFLTQAGRPSKRKVDSTWGEKNGKRVKPDDYAQAASKKKRVVKTGEDIGAPDQQLEEMVDKALKRVDLKLCIQLAIQACKKCGEVLLKKKNDPERGQHIEDIEEECCNILATAIARKYPLHTIVSRLNAEGIADISRAPTWCISSVESIDNFVRGSSLVCISIGLCVEKRPVLGVIYNPILGHLFAARRKAGTFVNKSEENKRLVMKPVRLPDLKSARDAVISNEYSAGNYRNGLAELGSRFKETGSLSNNFLDVLRKISDGGFQATFEGPWSVCAGVALIEEAGGLVTDLEGNRFQLNMKKREMVYGTRKLVEEMLQFI